MNGNVIYRQIEIQNIKIQETSPHDNFMVSWELQEYWEVSLGPSENKIVGRITKGILGNNVGSVYTQSFTIT